MASWCQRAFPVGLHDIKECQIKPSSSDTALAFLSFALKAKSSFFKPQLYAPLLHGLYLMP
jgi:hypothetical protein